MNKKTSKKLALAKQTISNIGLDHAAGGAINITSILTKCAVGCETWTQTICKYKTVGC